MTAKDQILIEPNGKKCQRHVKVQKDGTGLVKYRGKMHVVHIDEVLPCTWHMASEDGPGGTIASTPSPLGPTREYQGSPWACRGVQVIWGKGENPEDVLCFLEGPAGERVAVMESEL